MLKVGHKEVLYTLERARTSDRINGHEYSQYDQHGHHDLGHALNAVFNARKYDYKDQRTKQQKPEFHVAG